MPHPALQPYTHSTARTLFVWGLRRELALAVAFSLVLMRSVLAEVSGVTRVWRVMNLASPFMLATLLLPLFIVEVAETCEAWIDAP